MAGVAAVVLVGVGLIVGTFVAMGREAPPSTEATPYIRATISAEPVDKPDLVALGSRLQGPEPMTVAVVGDSTGNAPDEWVYLFGQRLAGRGRTVIIHDWDVDQNAYTTETTLGPIGGAALEIWNGSASGKNAQYSADNWKTLVPQPPDLVIFSHGHNQSDASQAVAGMGGLMNKLSPAVPRVIVLQNPRADEYADRQAGIVSELRDQFGSDRSPVALIDVYSAFEKTGDLPAFLNAQDQFHPNLPGEQLWEQTVASAFGLLPA